MQVLCRGGLCGCVCRLSVVNFVECCMVVDVGCVCCACWCQCDAMRNCSAWFMLVNVGFVERSAF